MTMRSRALSGFVVNQYRLAGPKRGVYGHAHRDRVGVATEPEAAGMAGGLAHRDGRRGELATPGVDDGAGSVHDMASEVEAVGMKPAQGREDVFPSHDGHVKAA